jgi:hypothetical protein
MDFKLYVRVLKSVVMFIYAELQLQRALGYSEDVIFVT